MKCRGCGSEAREVDGYPVCDFCGTGKPESRVKRWTVLGTDGGKQMESAERHRNPPFTRAESVWLRAIRCGDYRYPHDAVRYADEVLRAFKERFDNGEGAQ